MANQTVDAEIAGLDEVSAAAAEVHELGAAAEAAGVGELGAAATIVAGA